ncbi:RNA 2',3'-cyclic phosphodiesterase [Anaerobacillus sp. CMMVII]|uniref:RNA 2',3'-cyclic phosphodiesterase n=1 Tax=Anaerobacillus sp. CMMVII TaxID=2755588 RepID=UPI0021B7287B|nr:RNA 2',3'-cyclic phosphodiesterase [Anaerobacillus sp. CMMVII]MCT8137280.1 RNA 2',3'-cyclic phosphodiesterase [Anaerobacillus sp. CMMVII]
MTALPHYFIAVPADKIVKEKLANWVKREGPPFQKFVDQDDYHITLVFLGAVEPLMLEKLKTKLEIIAKEHQQFLLTLESIGSFGQKQAPRVFWASVEKEKKLYDLQAEVYKTCQELGFKLEKREFSPHITIARKYLGEGSYVDEQLKRTFQSSFKKETWTVSSFVIYQTHLKRTPKYEVIASFDLK